MLNRFQFLQQKLQQLNKQELYYRNLYSKYPGDKTISNNYNNITEEKERIKKEIYKERKFI